MVGGYCTFSVPARAQSGFSHDPFCGVAYGFGWTSPTSPLAESDLTNRMATAYQYEVKAALLYRCLELARWPSTLPAAKDSTITLGLLGDLPFRDPFKGLAGKTVAGHRLVVRQVSAFRKATGCQLIFVSATEQERIPRILEKLSGLPVLTIGETPGFVAQGGMINLLTESKRLRLEANPAAAARVGITLDPRLEMASRAAGSNHVYDTRGVIRALPADHHKVVIRHETIPDYMPAMTMEFTVRNPDELGGFNEGDRITFRLTATVDTHWIDHVRKVTRTSGTPSSPTPRTAVDGVTALKVGDRVPDCELIDESGRHLHLWDFRGKSVALTFIFTRCPLPDFCPRMGNNFAKARESLLAAGKGKTPTPWQFLSISFDPDYDKPEVLSNYADFYREGSEEGWLFAAATTGSLAELAPRLGLLVDREPGGGISHNLRTVVLDPQGRIYRQFTGNEWTPEDLAKALLESGRTP